MMDYRRLRRLADALHLYDGFSPSFLVGGLDYRTPRPDAPRYSVDIIDDDTGEIAGGVEFHLQDEDIKIDWLEIRKPYAGKISMRDRMDFIHKLKGLFPIQKFLTGQRVSGARRKNIEGVRPDDPRLTQRVKLFQQLADATYAYAAREWIDDIKEKVAYLDSLTPQQRRELADSSNDDNAYRRLLSTGGHDFPRRGTTWRQKILHMITVSERKRQAAIERGEYDVEKGWLIQP